MGIGLGGKCKSSPYSPSNAKAIEPRPSVFVIEEAIQVREHVVALVLYPHCTNFEGKKVLLFKDYTVEQLRERSELDPHFSRDADSPFARFKPTKGGWRAALMLARILK